MQLRVHTVFQPTDDTGFASPGDRCIDVYFIGFGGFWELAVSKLKRHSFRILRVDVAARDRSSAPFLGHPNDALVGRLIVWHLHVAYADSIRHMGDC